ncbi:hypothetical protein CRE_07839 [Caenorhabditis remanei]|uniref:Uncharacterized protein n=1 Tax=Caenorhabditis remanei TaxID=31234 RepID=E3NGY2_CAERE|nr:hypothetical protein CRE_07839 [Caenorhabditis remanei]
MCSPTLTTLPLLPMSIIVECLDVESLLSLSQTAKVFKDFIKEVHLKSGGYYISIQRDHFNISIKSRRYSYSYQAKKVKKDDFQLINNYLINKFSADFKKHTDLLPGNIDYLLIDPVIASKFKNVMSCAILSIGSIIPSSEFLESSLPDSVTFHKGLALNGVNVNNPDKIPKMWNIWNIDWLQIRNSSISIPLCQLNNKIINLWDISTITEPQINRYLQDLRDGVIDQPNLSFIQFRRQSGWNSQEILEGLGTVRCQKTKIYKLKDFDEKMRMDTFLPFGLNKNGIELSDTFDFVRRKDGVKCSIFLLSWVVRVYVWNQKETTKRGRGHMEDNDGGTAAKKSC